MIFSLAECAELGGLIGKRPWCSKVSQFEQFVVGLLNIKRAWENCGPIQVHKLIVEGEVMIVVHG